MTTEEKLWQIVERLHARTQRGVTEWQKTPSSRSFQTAFPRFGVRISEVESQEPETALDYRIGIYDESGRVIESASDVMLSKALGPGINAFEVMSNLYRLARRNALGVDAALDNLLASLAEEPGAG